MRLQGRIGGASRAVCPIATPHYAWSESGAGATRSGAVSAAQVRSQTVPVAGRAHRRWKSRTAASVAGPKSPSTSVREPASVSHT